MDNVMSMTINGKEVPTEELPLDMRGFKITEREMHRAYDNGFPLMYKGDVQDFINKAVSEGHENHAMALVVSISSYKGCHETWREFAEACVAYLIDHTDTSYWDYWDDLKKPHNDRSTRHKLFFMRWLNIDWDAAIADFKENYTAIEFNGYLFFFSKEGVRKWL